MEDWQGRDPHALIEADTLPGFYFRCNAGTLSELHQEAFFRTLGENARGLGEFLLFYLRVLGFVLDVITAGASGGIRRVVAELAADYLIDAATEAALDITGVENPWARAVIGAAVGFAPRLDPGSPKVRRPEEMELPGRPASPLAEDRGLVDRGVPTRTREEEAFARPHVQRRLGQKAAEPAKLAERAVALELPNRGIRQSEEAVAAASGRQRSRGVKASSQRPKVDKLAEPERTAPRKVSAPKKGPKSRRPRISASEEDSFKAAPKKKIAAAESTGSPEAPNARGTHKGKPDLHSRAVPRPPPSARGTSPKRPPLSSLELEQAEDLVKVAEDFGHQLPKSKTKDLDCQNLSPTRPSLSATRMDSPFTVGGGLPR